MLELKIDHYKNKDCAPILEDINCVAISVAKSWTGESIANFLQQVILVTGKPAAYLKDGGLDLEKGIKLLGNIRNISKQASSDIGNLAAQGRLSL